MAQGARAGMAMLVLGAILPFGEKAMANNFSPVGTEIQINNNAGRDEFDPDVAVMTDGRFFVAYERNINGAGSIEIRG